MAMSQFETGQLEIEQSQTETPDVTLFALNGPFTLGTMFPFQAILRDPATKGAIIEMAGVPYMDSAGMGLLMNQYVRCQTRGKKLIVSGANNRVMDLFKITKVDTVLPLAASVEEAETDA